MRGVLTVVEATILYYLNHLVDEIRHVDLHARKHGTSIISTKPQPHNTNETEIYPPTTCFAPALAANVLVMPVPQPTSSTSLSLNRCGLFMIALRYEPVLTASFSVSSWMLLGR